MLELGLVTSPVYSSGDLTRERDLQVTGAEQDLAHLFESSSSGDEDECAVVSDAKWNIYMCIYWDCLIFQRYHLDYS